MIGWTPAATICRHRLNRQVVFPMPGSPPINRCGLPLMVKGHWTSAPVRVSAPSPMAGTDGSVGASDAGFPSSLPVAGVKP